MVVVMMGSRVIRIRLILALNGYNSTKSLAFRAFLNGRPRPTVDALDAHDGEVEGRH